MGRFEHLQALGFRCGWILGEKPQGHQPVVAAAALGFGQQLHAFQAGKGLAVALSQLALGVEAAWQILQLGWVRFRSSTGKALHCRLGGDPSTAGGASVILPSELNRETVLMFMGRSAPQPPPGGGAYLPGCTVGARGSS